MMKTIFSGNPKFIKTALEVKDYPVLKFSNGKIMPEIAIVGRSNVGKSSLLNHLFQTKRLVRISSKPGKTQALNFFTVGDNLSFVDLPGYGFAKVPLAVRKKWGPMVQNYFMMRDSLFLILFLFDIRRCPNEDDYILMDWINNSKHEAILVFTKVDKVKKREVITNTKKILDSFGEPVLNYVHYSATKNIGRKELINKIELTCQKN